MTQRVAGSCDNRAGAGALVAKARQHQRCLVRLKQVVPSVRAVTIFAVAALAITVYHVPS
jgi:hypothetical protein